MNRKSYRVRDACVVFLLALAFLGIGLGTRDLWNPNEPTYGRVVAEMVESGDWLVPRLNDEPFVEKPILYYWLAAAFSHLAGDESESTVRLPVCLVTALCAALFYLLIEAYDGRRRAALGTALFLTTYSVWFTARNAQMDTFVLFSTLGVLLPLARRLDGEAPPRWSWLAAGLAAGFGFAAKGPVAVVVPALILAGYSVICGRPWRRLLPGSWLGLAAFVLVASPWYLALYLDGRAEALAELLLRQNVTRFVEAWDHRQPWWYYLEYFWLTFAPWSWFVPIVAVVAVRAESSEEGGGRPLAWIWLLVPLVFFSLSESKREPYLLPVAPAVSWIVAGLAERLLSGEARRWQARAAIGVATALSAVLAAAAVWALRVDAFSVGEELQRVVASAFFVAAAAIGLVIAGPERRRRAVLGVGAAFIWLYLFTGLYGHRVVNPFKSYRPAVRDLERAVPREARLHSFFGGSPLRGGYPYYLERSLPDLATPDEARRAWVASERPCVVTEKRRRAEWLSELPGAQTLLERPVGGNHMWLVCRKKPMTRAERRDLRRLARRAEDSEAPRNAGGAGGARR